MPTTATIDTFSTHRLQLLIKVMSRYYEHFFKKQRGDFKSAELTLIDLALKADTMAVFPRQHIQSAFFDPSFDKFFKATQPKEEDPLQSLSKRLSESLVFENVIGLIFQRLLKADAEEFMGHPKNADRFAGRLFCFAMEAVTRMQKETDGRLGYLTSVTFNPKRMNYYLTNDVQRLKADLVEHDKTYASLLSTTLKDYPNQVQNFKGQLANLNELLSPLKQYESGTEYFKAAFYVNSIGDLFKDVYNQYLA